MTAKKLLFKDSRPLKYFIFSLTCVVFAVMLTSCEQNPTAPNEPPKPPGYQEDIYWPSLADSPWPMYRGNPQYTGRSEYNGPVTGIVQWSYDSVYIESGVLIGADNSTIFQTSGLTSGKGGVYNLNQSGDLNWYYKIPEIAAGTTPLLLSDSTLIVSTYIGGKIIALTNNEEEKWIYDTETYVTTRGMNVGYDGTIYFIDSTKSLFALGKDGVLKWTLKIENFFGNGSNHRIAFSPDGKTLYITALSKAIYAVDVNLRTIIWTYGGENIIASPIVDSKGGIYLFGKPDINVDKTISMLKLNSFGSIEWEYIISYSNSQNFADPTLDKYGNIYCGVDTLYSLDYNGKLNWKVSVQDSLGGFISSSLTCDAQNNIFIPIQTIEGAVQFKILTFSNDGRILWQSAWLSGRAGDSPALGIGSLRFPTYRSSSFYFIK